ncbi:DUF3791 domain-containing protein [Ruminococcus sp. HUN007]|uniref:DUF3791 domain-containing protein n=1 Tax=Ruminococcus sp. HUN007 TaxID=1514668 RepID=UPI0005D2590D|nr:DUF3791 domain-containing protein [Ruminococcus sp. HUN007]
MNRETTEFVIYIINQIANIKNMSPSKVYSILNKTGCIKEYLVPLYDVLHTLSSNQVAEDVIEFVTTRGEVI